MMDNRLKKQLDFVVEIDKMKTVLRRSAIISEPRRENNAEHSWHFATMAMLLYEYAYTDKVDLTRVLKMALIHDLVEIYAGDTFAFDKQANLDKEDREEKAADKIFGMLPEEQGKEYRELWNWKKDDYAKKELIDFFFSDWFSVLTKLDPKYLVEELEEEANAKRRLHQRL